MDYICIDMKITAEVKYILEMQTREETMYVRLIA
jgi:hypothetical protein